MKHWTRYLPEFGRSYIVDSIEWKLDKIAQLNKQIEIVKAEIKEQESELLHEHIKPNWTDQEIAKAKLDCKTKA